MYALDKIQRTFLNSFSWDVTLPETRFWSKQGSAHSEISEVSLKGKPKTLSRRIIKHLQEPLQN